MSIIACTVGTGCFFDVSTRWATLLLDVPTNGSTNASESGFLLDSSEHLIRYLPSCKQRQASMFTFTETQVHTIDTSHASAMRDPSVTSAHNTGEDGS